MQETNPIKERCLEILQNKKLQINIVQKKIMKLLSKFSDALEQAEQARVRDKINK